MTIRQRFLTSAHNSTRKEAICIVLASKRTQTILSEIYDSCHCKHLSKTYYLSHSVPTGCCYKFLPWQLFQCDTLHFAHPSGDRSLPKSLLLLQTLVLPTNKRKTKSLAQNLNFFVSLLQIKFLQVQRRMLCDYPPPTGISQSCHFETIPNHLHRPPWRAPFDWICTP